MWPVSLAFCNYRNCITLFDKKQCLTNSFTTKKKHNARRHKTSYVYAQNNEISNTSRATNSNSEIFTSRKKDTLKTFRILSDFFAINLYHIKFFYG
jgi:hypothetical protein